MLPIALGIWEPEGDDLRCLFYNRAAVDSTDGLNQSGVLLGEMLPGHRKIQADGRTQLDRYIAIAQGIEPGVSGPLEYAGFEISTSQFWQSAQPIELQGRQCIVIAWAPLAQFAICDPMTGLFSRQYLEIEINRSIRQAPSSSFVLFLDLDKFKPINDVRGHAAGDYVLRCVAQRIKGALRSTDTAARWGGDEFAVLVRDGDGDKVYQFAEQLREAIEKPVDGFAVTASIGCTTVADTLEATMAVADCCVYLAKEKGGNKVVVSDPAIIERHNRHQRILEAIENDEFLLYYQPIVGLRSGNVAGYEALVRWQDGDKLVSPDAFVPELERTGEIWRLCKKVFAMAAAQQRLIAPLWVSVNLSPVTLDRHDFREIAKPMIGGHFEVLESRKLSDNAVAELALLRANGSKIALDDFGVGQSRYAEFDRVDLLKLDKSLVDGVEQDIRVVAGILGMAHSIGLQVVAEGIETKKQADLLQQIGCDFGQGWFFGKPVPLCANSKKLSQTSLQT
jgi:diguanylate cyclase (GGDEF)-like protein